MKRIMLLKPSIIIIITTDGSMDGLTRKLHVRTSVLVEENNDVEVYHHYYYY